MKRLKELHRGRLPFATAAPAPPANPGGSDLSTLEAAIVRLTNAERQRAGLPPLQVNAQLMSAARHHARNMGQFALMQHTIAGAGQPYYCQVFGPR